MRRRKLFVLVSVALIVLVPVAVAHAFSLGNVDGVWSAIDGGGGASCDRWATGPVGGSTSYDSPTTTWDAWNAQGPLNTDWNQVRYGDLDGSGCGTFGNQSGFGFDGVNDVDPDPSDPYVYEPFYLGQFCHFNNSIPSPGNPFGYVDLAITIDNLVCPGGGVISPSSTLDVSYRFTLDETDNDPDDHPGDECPYGDDDPCGDQVTVAKQSTAASFRCTNPDTTYADFTIDVLGFIPAPGNVCPGTYSAANVKSTFFSDEDADNCACLWAEVTDYVATAVDLVSFTAAPEGDAIRLDWTTGSETDNLGFNLYRSHGTEAEIQLNGELIPSAAPPGSPFGADYSWLDQDVTPGIKYYYWLEDVELSGATTRHGPVLEGTNLPTSENPDQDEPPGDPAPAAEPPPFVPEASTLILLGSAASGLAGYVSLQIRARRRRLITP